MVKVFLSWSGDRSKLIAAELKDWLRFVINDLEPFMSADIEAGARWQGVIASELQSTQFGIILVTQENQDSRWLNFEAGALAKAVDVSRVVPLAVNLKPTEIRQPLGQFQAQPLNATGVLAVLRSINQHCANPLTAEHLEKSFDRWWPDMQAIIERALEIEGGNTDTPNELPNQHEVLNEILDTVRALARLNPSRRSPFNPPPGAREYDRFIHEIGELASDLGYSETSYHLFAPDRVDVTVAGMNGPTSADFADTVMRVGLRYGYAARLVPPSVDAPEATQPNP
jgi:hypothetical protein